MKRGFHAMSLACWASLMGCGELADDRVEDPDEPAAQVAAPSATLTDAGAGDAGADAGRADAGLTLDAGGLLDASRPVGACDQLTYDSFGKAFLQKYCTRCHQGPRAPASINLTTLDGVKTNKGEIDAHAVKTPRSRPMPPPSAPQPTADERKRLGEWLTCGPD